MSSPDFAPGNVLYDRFIWCLKDRMQPVDLLVSFYQDGRCSQVAFPAAAFPAKRLALKSSHSEHAVVVPQACPGDDIPFLTEGVINSSKSGRESPAEATAHEFFLWQGFAACDALT